MTTSDGFNLLDKATKKGNITDHALDLEGVKLQACKMVHHHHHHRHHNHPVNLCHPFQSNGIGDGNGPTCDRNRPFIADVCNFVSDGVCGAAEAAVARSGGAVGVRTMQPFDIYPTAFKSPGGNINMAAASLVGFPFTIAQWKELERQAMIYKHMMACLPVPPHLLFPTSGNHVTSSSPTAPHSPLGSVVNLRFVTGADLEPGRCRRTDGKKWRCSRDVAPDQKYCERHMHRGRPRSRKHVELNSNSTINNMNNSKKTRHCPAATSAKSPVIAATCNLTVYEKGSSASEFVGTISQPCLQRPAFLDKAATFDVNNAFVSPYKEPRNLDWMMMKGEPAPIAIGDEQQWNHHLLQTEIGLATDSSFNEILNLKSFGNFSAGKDAQSKQCTMFLDETPRPRGFIDAWSNAASDEHNINPTSANPICSNEKLSLYPLTTVSMGGRNKMGQIQTGLGLMESDQKHERGSSSSTTPGGPLAEVVQLSTLNTAINESSSAAKHGDTDSPDLPSTTVSSSPSGVLQRTLASFSDSSGNSSPILGSSSTKPEISLL